MNTEIRYMSKWEAVRDFSLGIGSNSCNPNTTDLLIKKGTFLFWEDDSLNGNVWFIVEINGLKYRGKKESGCILNLVKRDLIKLIDNGQSFVIYSQNYVNNYLNA